MSKDVIIGGAWPYANYYMHVGHLAALLPGDIIARYYRQHGDNVYYVSGTDCHGTPITMRAKKEGVDPKTISEKYHKAFDDVFRDLHFSYDLYTNTMTAEHKEFVHKCLKKIMANGYMYEKTLPEDYCDKCKKTLSDREIIGVCPYCNGVAKGDQCESCNASLSADEVKDKTCAYCGGKTVKKDNTHIYFKLSALQKIIEELLSSHENLWRNNAVNETKKFLKMGLIDRAVTRQIDWGIEVPFDNFDDKRIYVWFEAVLGYMSTVSRVCKARGIDFEKVVKGKNTISYYVHGKDNIPFHTVIYPALLSAIDPKYNLPDYIISSEYVNCNGEKMSKSKGNLITCRELLDLFPVDTIRYYFIAFGPEKKDVSISYEDMVAVHNKFLVGVIGNFVNRNIAFVNKKFGGKIEEANVDSDIVKSTRETYERVGKLIEQGELKSALEEVKDYAVLGNKYYDASAPWIKVKEDKKAFDDITYTCLYMIANLANMLTPFVPSSADRLLNMLNIIPTHKWDEITLSGDYDVSGAGILFERIDDTKKPEVKPEQKKEEPKMTHKELIDIDTFDKAEIRVGEVLASEKVEKSDKLLKNTVKIGDEVRTIVSGIAKHYNPDQMVGKKVLVVTNLKPIKLRGIESNGMILCAVTEGDEVLKIATVDGEIPSGSEVC